MNTGPGTAPLAASNGGSELDRLWALLGELSTQLSHNRLQTEELQQRAEELKNQAVHTQTGFTLRRFNIDVSQEEFESELERLNVQLVLENQNLQQENRQLSALLKDYESTLDTVMAKFRAYAFATQQHHLDLVRHYENMLLAMPNLDLNAAAGSHAGPSSSSGALDSPSSTEQLDPLQVHMSLLHLGSLIRKALRSLQGEDPDDSSSPMLLPSTARDADMFFRLQRDGSPGPVSDGGNRNVSRTRVHDRDVSEGGYIGRSASTDPHYIPTTSTSSLVGSPTSNNVGLPNASTGNNGNNNNNNSSSVTLRATEPGSQDNSFAHSAAEHQELLNKLLKGPVDEALEREIQLEQLRQENEQLRRLLGISEELDKSQAQRGSDLNAVAED
ncbi:hypothetical protein ACM66B_005713 [Microbotryomycetes sp. NB124-2]